MILDGYPRDQWQSDWIVDHGDDKYIDGAIIFDVSREELWHRLELRGRADDTREAIEKRWNIVEQNIYSMIERLRGAGVKITHINGEGEIVWQHTGYQDGGEEEVIEKVRELLK